MLINVVWYLSAVEMSFSCLYIFITYLHGIVNNTTTSLLAGFWSVLHSRGRIPCELYERGGAWKLVGKYQNKIPKTAQSGQFHPSLK